MLVLKEVIARVEGGSVIIFDEADSGVGGAIAEAVGQKIRNLSRTYQVICITHLPQVAKFADSHLTVSKTHDDNQTQVTIKSLEGNERVVELARMIGGFNITQKNPGYRSRNAETLRSLLTLSVKNVKIVFKLFKRIN